MITAVRAVRHRPRGGRITCTSTYNSISPDMASDMPSRPLEVYEVLEQEYLATHGPIVIAPFTVTAEQILDAAAARALLIPLIGHASVSDKEISEAIDDLRKNEFWKDRRFRDTGR